MGYGTGAGPTDLIQTLRELKQNPPESLHETGGHISNANLSFTQLRRSAEEAIRVRNWEEASSLLMLASLMRQKHRNVARRLWAVQAQPTDQAPSGRDHPQGCGVRSHG